MKGIVRGVRLGGDRLQGLKFGHKLIIRYLSGDTEQAARILESELRGGVKNTQRLPENEGDAPANRARSFGVQGF